MDKAGKPEPKKPYTPPVLTKYGTVRDLTNRVGRSGRRDGGSFRSGRFRTA
ncbi:MAG: lasso RiPP family leader peptide-containing protein [Candidatus Acidiferrales bacterium]